MFSVHPHNLVGQIVDNGPQLFNLPPQRCHLIIIVVVLEGGNQSLYKEVTRIPPTCAMFPLINLHSRSPITAEYLITLVAPSLGPSITSWSNRPQFKRWNSTLISSSIPSAVRISLLVSRRCWVMMDMPKIWSSRTILVGKSFNISCVKIPTVILAI